MSGTEDRKNHAKFVLEPMNLKKVQEIPGIGPVLSAVLTGKGYILAYQVLGQFLMLRDQEEEFQEWFKTTADAKRQDYGERCSKGLEEWCQKHFDKSIPTASNEADRKFVDVPMGEKPITAILGLEWKYHKAYQIFGQFLIEGKNEERFQTWLKDNVIANNQQAKDCSTCMNKWCKRHFDEPMPSSTPTDDDEEPGRFIAEPMGEKPISEIPGLKLNYHKAYQVFGKFLALNKNEEKFHEWLKDTVKATEQQAKDCSTCMMKWFENYFH